MGKRSPVAWAMTSVRVKEVFSSMPLDTETMTVPSSISAPALAAVERTAKEGGARNTTGQPLTQDMSAVSSSSGGRVTPGRTGFSRFSRRLALSLSR